jgi:hypothetical protein
VGGMAESGGGPGGEKKTHGSKEDWLMPGNLKIWNPEPPPEAGRGAKRQRPDDVEWHAVTTLADGSEDWKWGNDPVKEASGQGFAQQMFVKKWLKNEPDAEVWRQVVELGRAKVEKRERELEAERTRRGAREAHNREELVLRRLMDTTVKRLAKAVNQVKIGPAEVQTPMVTTRELRAAFREFLLDAGMDKGLKTPHEYRQWLWTDRNTVYLAPAGRRKRGGLGAGGRVTAPGKTD